VSVLTEKQKTLRAGVFNKEKTGAKWKQLEQIKNFTTIVAT